MIYAVVFGFTYVGVFIAVFAILSTKTASVGANMINQGITRDDVNAFYISMRGKTVVAAIQATVITGTLLAALISAGVWALR